MLQPPPPDLVESIERVLGAKDPRLIRDLRAGVPDAFIFVGNLFIDEEAGLQLAERCFRYAIEGGAVAANVNLGRIMSRMPGREADAERAYQAAIATGSAGARNNLGVLYARMPGRLADAEIAYQSAINAGDMNALYNLGLLLAPLENRLADALGCFLLADSIGYPQGGEQMGKLFDKCRARGMDDMLFTAEGIRAARALRRRLPSKPPRSTASVLAALRVLSQDDGREATIEVARQVPAACTAYQSDSIEAGDSACTPATRVFTDIASLLSFLEAEHSEGRFVYRGQVHRRPAHRILDRVGNEFIYENLFPHDFRFITDPSMRDMTLLAERLSTTRSQASRRCFEFIRHLASGPLTDSAGGRALRRWIMTRDPMEYAAIRYVLKLVGEEGAPHLMMPDVSFGQDSLWRILWSLAQHYELSTALLDVTYSPRVAAWFATQNWSENTAPPKQGTGVIYRFDLAALQGLLKFFGSIEHVQAKDLTGLPGSPRASPFLQDLRAIPPDCASRPTGQQGASLYGLDSIWLLGGVCATGVLEVFEFGHGTASDIGIDRAAIMPVNDPFLPAAAAFENAPAH